MVAVVVVVLVVTAVTVVVVPVTVAMTHEGAAETVAVVVWGVVVFAVGAVKAVLFSSGFRVGGVEAAAPPSGGLALSPAWGTRLRAGGGALLLPWAAGHAPFWS